MVFRKYPDEIEKLMAIWRPYGIKISENNLEGVPQSAIDAYNICKKWAWEQDQ